jgi:hypothetical protein
MATDQQSGASADDTPALTPAVRQLLADRKLTIPAEMVRAAGWDEGKSGAIKLIADLDEPGHLTLWKYETASTSIAALVADLEEEPAQNESVAHQVIRDRYQSLGMDSKGHRIRLNELVLLHMGIDPSSSVVLPWFYVQSNQRHRIEVMTVEFRNRRLHQWQSRTSFG